MCILLGTSQELLVYGKQFGNVFIGVQPTFGYEGDPMRLLFSRSASPHHGRLMCMGAGVVYGR